MAALNWAKSQTLDNDRAVIRFPASAARSRNRESSRVANFASITDAPVVPFSILSTERLKGSVGVVWPTGTTKN